jgi:hypothetical protein
MIDREMIEQMFEQASQSDAPFDVKGECLWSYFFIDADPEKLVLAGEELEKQGFTIAGLLEPETENEEEEPEIYCLQLDRVETHSVDSLVELNKYLTEFAESKGLESYDGMEVGSLDFEDEGEEHEGCEPGCCDSETEN